MGAIKKLDAANTTTRKVPESKSTGEILFLPSGLFSLSNLNSSFDTGVLRICYWGLNRKGSFISKQTIEKCIPTMFNCPIVCNYDRDTNSIGGHNIAVAYNDKGSAAIINLTEPVGVIPESAKYWWETVKDGDAEHEYLCVQAYIWKRQQAYEKIKNNEITDQSMEINVRSGQYRNGVFEIDDFEFVAFCLLENAEPCYESARLLVSKYSFLPGDIMSDDEHSNYFRLCKEMMNELYSEITQKSQEPARSDNISLSPEGIIINNNQSMRGGQMALENNENATYALESNFMNELLGALSAEKYEQSWGESQRYMYFDYDKDLSRVYAWDVSDWNIYGFNYAVNGDTVAIDFSSKKRVKLALTEFNEGENANETDGTAIEEPANTISQVASEYSERIASLMAERDRAVNALNEANNELEQLREYKINAETQRLNAERNAVISEFSDLNGIDEFESLRADIENYSADELREKCYAVRGKNMIKNAASANFSYEQPEKAPKLPVAKREVNNEPYGGIFLKYGIVKND